MQQNMSKNLAANRLPATRAKSVRALLERRRLRSESRQKTTPQLTAKQLKLAPICPYCQMRTILVKGDELYHGRRDLANKNFWLCKPCDAYVGCHREGIEPLGTPANAKLRQLRGQAHGVFDLLWREHPRRTRRDAYAWLGKKLKIPQQLRSRDCHIAMFDEKTCRRVIKVSRVKLAQDRKEYLG